MQTNGKNKLKLNIEKKCLEQLISIDIECLVPCFSIIAYQNNLQVYATNSGLFADEQDFIKATKILVKSVLYN
jgi:hypothetical protein